MSDIVVTTPKSERANSAREAAACIREGRGVYFRRLASIPKDLALGDRVFYVEDGYVRGFARVIQIWRDTGAGFRCEVTGREFPPGNFVMMGAASWTWILPIPMKGFQGWRYFKWSAWREVGGWKDPKPDSGTGSRPAR